MSLRTPIPKNFEIPKKSLSVSIPRNFDQPWSNADVVLKVPDGGVEKSVYVNKKLLTMFSPYFSRMFNGDWKEKKEGDFTLKVSYKVFLRALRLLHHMGYDEQSVSVDGLVETFRIGDQLDIPKVRQLCHHISKKLSNPDRLKFLETIDTIQGRREVFEKLTSSELSEYMAKCPPETMFSVAEVLAITKQTSAKAARTDLPKCEIKLCRDCCGELSSSSSDDLCVSCEEVRIPSGFEISWSHSDVALITEIEDEKPLYVNEEVLSIFCQLPKTRMLDGQKCKFIKGDYDCVKEALRVLHFLQVPEISSAPPDYVAKLVTGLNALKTVLFADECSIRIGKTNNYEKLEYYTRMDMFEQQIRTMQLMKNEEIVHYVIRNALKGVVCGKCGGNNIACYTAQNSPSRCYCKICECNLYDW